MHVLLCGNCPALAATMNKGNLCFFLINPFATIAILLPGTDHSQEALCPEAVSGLLYEVLADGCVFYDSLVPGTACCVCPPRLHPVLVSYLFIILITAEVSL